MNPGIVAVAGLLVAGLVVFLSLRRANAERVPGRPVRRSIPDALDRARRTKGRALVLFLPPDDADSRRALDLLTSDPSLAPRLANVELVRIDVLPGDLEVAKHLATKYGQKTLELPTLLLLDAEGLRLASIDGQEALGLTEPTVRERLVALLGRQRD